ncbi:DUF4037 domain-containing protein [Streptacidiphilus carbonis]|uniref:DUF4037 domain-containing protein n=1 Tax=Streptacidiphilus carbonis TaxID=105422 RepID=UPI0005AAABA9|nr:DUF4037 domain-containing protein [Streptacidiphilus carbonis]
MTAIFRPGLELCGILYEEAVRPLLDEVYPGMPYTAARIGSGSEVLGFDTERSPDHEWGPRLQLLLRPEHAAAYASDLSRLLAERLPKEVRGWPTNFAPPGERVQVMTPTAGPVNHRIDVVGTADWLGGALGFDPLDGPVGLLDWLATPGQRLLEVVSGAVYHDGLGGLTAARAALSWYPDDVWRYLLACQWQRISQEEAFVGRTAEVGDDLGSRVVAARLARELMRLCLLLARRYAPYGKWLGTAFGRLPEAAPIAALLRASLAADWPSERGRALAEACSLAGAWQNRLDVCNEVDPSVRRYHGRPFPVVHAERFTAALRDAVTDPAVRAMPPVGGIDQFVDSTDALGDLSGCRALVRAALGLTGEG